MELRRFKRGLGKKGSIPVVSEIIQVFLAITPKPILLLLFILLITTMAQVILPAITSILGYVCAYDLQNNLHLYQIPVGDAVAAVIVDISTGGNFTYYPDQEIAVIRDTPRTEFISLQCLEAGAPRLELFGFPLFDQQMWIFLMIGYALIALAFFYYNMVGLNR